MNIPISKFVIKDRHGNILRSDSFTTVAQVVVSADDGVGNPSADSSYKEGVLRINFHNIKADSIQSVTFEESQEDGGTNYLHVKMVSDSGEPSYTFPIKNGRRGNGITFINVEENQVDGGDNIVHIHCTDDEEAEGTQFRVKNGRRGNGIASVTEQTSLEDGGINTHTLTDTDGHTHVIHTRNGRTGRAGADFQPIEDVSGLSIAHSLGDDETKVMSQKGVTDAFYSELGDYTENVLEDVDNITVYDNKYYAIVSGGSETSSAAWKYIKFPVEVGRTYRVKGAAGSNARLWILLNSNNGIIKSHSDSSAASLKEDDVKVTNENAAYMIVNTQKDILSVPVIKVRSLTRTLQKTNKAEQNNTLPMTSKGVYALYNGLSVKQLIKDINVPSSQRVVGNGYINWDGTEKAVSGWRWTKVSVEEGENYTVTAAAGQNARLYLVLNSSDAVLKIHGYSEAPVLNTSSITIPANGAYLVVNTMVSLFGTPTIIRKTIINIDSVDDIPTENSGNFLLSGAIFDAFRNIGGNKGNILYGKTLCVAGDSITYGADMDAGGFTSKFDINFYQWVSSTFQQVTENARKTYGFLIAERNNMTFYNQGISGSTVQDIDGKNGFSAENGRYTKLPDNIDYLVLFFGWNDEAYGTLGTIEDNDNQSYYGAYNVVLPYLIDKYPYTKICLVVPFGTTEGHRNAVRQLCNKWGIACFDFYGAGTPLYYGKEASVGVNGSIVTANRAKFQANGAHPNHYGHKQLADMLEGFLRTI